MQIPQIIYLSLVMISLLYTSYRHGESREDEKYNIFQSLIGTFVILSLLILGGFFK